MAKYTDVSVNKLNSSYTRNFCFSDLDVGDFFRMTNSESGNIFVKISKTNSVNTMAVTHDSFGCGSLSVEIGSLRVFPLKQVVISVSP